MKLLLLVSTFLFSTYLLTACQNTATGFHQDWRNNTQSITNEINKA